MKALDITKIKDLEDVQVILLEAFPKLSSRIIDFVTALRNASGAGAKAKVVFSSLGSVFSKFGSVISAHPIIAAATALIGLVKVLDWVLKDAERAREKMEESFSAYETAQSELESVNKELEENENRIKELESLDSLTWVEQQELDKLREANALLEYQKTIKEENARIAANQAADDAIESYKKSFPTSASKASFDEYITTREASGAYSTPNRNNNAGLLAEIERFKEEQNKALKAGDEELAKYYESQSSLYANYLWNNLAELENYRDKMSIGSEEYQQEYAKQAQDEIDFIMKMLDPAKWKTSKYASIISKDIFSDAKESLLDLVGTHTLTVNDIVKKYPELKEAIEESGITVRDFVDEFNAQNFSKGKGEVTDAANSFELIQGRAEQVKEATDSLISGLSKVKDVLSSQSTGNSISYDDFNSDDLKNYTSALEYHNGVLRLNAEKVSEIVEAKAAEAIATNDANKAIEQSKYLDNAAKIEKLRKKLKEKNYEEGESAEIIQANIEALLDENDAIKTQCDSYDLMSASLREARDSYHNWLNARNAAESGDMFDDTLDAINHIIDTLNDAESDLYGRVGRQDYKAAVGLIVPDSVDPEDADKINSYLASIYDLFTYDDNGNRAGLNIENFCQKAVDAGLMVIDEASDSYQIAGQKTMEDFAEGLNLSLPLVQAMFGEMEEFGGVFSWADETNKTIGDLAVSANVAAENLRTLNKDITINLDVSDIPTAKGKVDALDSTIQQMQEHKGKLEIDPSEIEYANSIISYCVTQKQQLENPAILEIDTSKVAEISETAASAVSLLQEFKTEYNNLQLQQSLDLDTKEAQAKVDSLLQQISSSDNDYIVNLALDSSSAETLNSAITSLSVEDVKVGFNIDDAELVSYQPEDKKATVTYNIDTSAVDAYKPQNLSRTVTYYVRTVGSVNANVNGTAHAAGTAMAGGNWGTAPGGKTLTGELGREIVVFKMPPCMVTYMKNFI